MSEPREGPMFCARRMLRRGIGIERLNLEIDPDVTVAWGCASVVD